MGANEIELTIDGKKVIVEEGVTILEAADRNGIHIPTLCHHPSLSDWGGCRMCVVQVDGAPKLAASCVTPVRKDMEVETASDAVIESRRMILEFLFAERNHNCMFCPKSGDCDLQALAYELQMDHLTVSFSYNKFPTDVTSEYMVIDHNRCILCGRCVRACREIAGARVLDFHNRGPQNLIGFDLNESREHSTCGNCGICMQVCPTGAITNRYRSHYLVKGHSKKKTKIESLCPQCGLLCPTVSSICDNNLLEVEGKLIRSNGRPDQGQLCYKGRFEVLKNTGKRLLQPQVRDEGGTWKESDWESALDLTAKRLAEARDGGGKGEILGLISSSASNDNLILFRDLMTKEEGIGSLDTLDGDHYRSVAQAWKALGKTFQEASWKKIPEADFILLMGGDPQKTHPLISLLIRKGLSDGTTRVATVGDGGQGFPFATYRLGMGAPDTEGCGEIDQGALARALLIAASASSGANRSPANPEHAGDTQVPELLKKAGIGEKSLTVFEETVQAFAEARQPLIIVGEELTRRGDPACLSDLFRLAHLKSTAPSDHLGLILLKPSGNSGGAWRLGLPSLQKPGVKERARAGILLLAGERFLDPLMGERLKEMDFLAVLTPYVPEDLGSKANVLIPTPLWTEERGAFTSLDGGEISCMERILLPPKGVRDTWHTLQSLAERIGFHPEYAAMDEVSAKMK